VEIVRAARACSRAMSRAAERGPRASLFEKRRYFVVAWFCGAERERCHGSARSWAMAKRTIDELSGSEKWQVADELMLPTGFFGVVLMAAVLLLAFLLGPFSSLAGPVQSSGHYDAHAIFSLPENGG
jgi:hypothetical protein